MAGALTAAIAAAFSGGGSPPVTTDEYFEYTTLLLPGNGTNGAQNNTFLDGSTNNFTITRNGNTTQGTFSPFSQTGWGNYFDGTGDYLTTPDNVAFTVGSGNWTLEAWVYPTASPNQPIIFGQWSGGTDGSVAMMLSNDGNRYLRGLVYSGGYVDRVSGSSLQLNAWNHCAFVREGTFLNLYLNGSRVDNYSFGSGSVQDSSLVVSVGAASSGIQPFQGYISNCRFLKGIAQYTGATYTVPTAPLTAISGTSLLTCQSNRFIDNSTNNFTITRNGDTRVVAFSPFNPTASWSAATYGGSGYFDGSGDYLSVADNAAFTLGTNNWTLEGWFYANSYPNYARLWGQSTAGATGNNSVGLFFDTNGIGTGINIRYGTTSNQTNDTGFITVDAGKYQWHHIAVVRDVNTMRLYFNGVQKTTVNLTGVTIYDSSAVFAIGANSSGTENWDGYLSNVRLVNGTCLYPNGTSFTPSTTPLTAITNTSLLLNFTNAGIYDATSKNDLETVGNAQISTTQSKWSGSSMYFDGTGDWLKTPSSTLWQFGTGDFTIEFWWYPNSLATYQQILSVIDNVGVTGAGQFAITYNTSLGLRFYINAGATTIDQGSTSGWSAGQWYYIAAVRNGNTLTLYRNGTSIASGSVTGITIGANVPVYIGGEQYTPHSNNCYLQDVRITKGYARTVTTSPTAAFPTL